MRSADFVRFPFMGNFTAMSAMSVPPHWHDKGLPIGTMLTGRFGDEATLFRLAA